MKLSELVNFYNELCKLSALPTKDVYELENQKILLTLDHQQVKFTEVVNELKMHGQDISRGFEQYENVLSKIKKEYKSLILETEKPWYTESYRLYDQEMQNETIEEIKNRTANNISENAKNFYLARISKYNSWKHTALVVRPGFEPYISHMVGCDPLYVIDTNYDLIKPALEQFNELYQRRLRNYTINEKDGGEILNKLPAGQFGFVLVFNFFNFRPFEVIRRYLEEIYQKLQPGGVLAMTFNDCDNSKAVMLVEQHFCCYTPGYLVLDLAKSVGFEPLLRWNDGGPSTWLELKKPGSFQSLRGGQALAKVIPK